MPQKKECVGVERELPKGFEYITLYHVTTNVPKVCREGLKSTNELRKIHKKSNKKPSYSQGIGGSNDNMLSFTYNRDLAEDYFHDVVTMAKIANGDLPPEKMCNYLNKNDSNAAMKKKPCDIWLSLGSKNYSQIREHDMRHLIKGEVYHPRDMCDLYRELPSDTFQKEIDPPPQLLALLKDACANNRKMGGSSLIEKYNYRKGTDDEIRNMMSRIYSIEYAMERSSNGGRRNPAIMAGGVSNFKNIKPSDVGIVQVLAAIPPIEDAMKHNNPERDSDYDREYTKKQADIHKRSFPNIVDQYLHLDYAYTQDQFPSHRSPYHDKIKVLGWPEDEIRITPEWTSNLKIIKQSQP